MARRQQLIFTQFQFSLWGIFPIHSIYNVRSCDNYQQKSTNNNVHSAINRKLGPSTVHTSPVQVFCVMRSPNGCVLYTDLILNEEREGAGQSVSWFAITKSVFHNFYRWLSSSTRVGSTCHLIHAVLLNKQTIRWHLARGWGEVEVFIGHRGGDSLRVV